ncbi:hypothetical protein COU17_01180 [Candidatus Kaiserbacteria bacterium CG10_big_fil_rev_8_21_14_0_10_49_17]|uniref:Uncharacterized protein n=1 Tax=Candidatus Kaiserbacteria bacterium CG10_big_fil_rev_8_21_14_0_10_49_17 TaxID=1974609 RepID=A0A2M6WEK9_9BACT|nr:MAG: hypothetical protein COU17_01180 [Candidatus Kaiserbacteria bacterium CG10_big_fil_rev_8_21_14_0_10_49_17]
MKNAALIGGGIVVLLGLLYVLSLAGRGPQENLVSPNGLHWHPTMTIYVDGEKQPIPANIGLVGRHYPMHTHIEDVGDGVIHFEFGGKVYRDDLRLKHFFSVWNGMMVENAFGRLNRMLVNGEEITEYGEYVVNQNDAIELFYESSENAQ